MRACCTEACNHHRCQRGIVRSGNAGRNHNLKTPYLKHLLGFIGVTDVTVIQVGATFKVDRGMASPDEVVAPVESQLAAAAAR